MSWVVIVPVVKVRVAKVLVASVQGGYCPGVANVLVANDLGGYCPGG